MSAPDYAALARALCPAGEKLHAAIAHWKDPAGCSSCARIAAFGRAQREEGRREAFGEAAKVARAMAEEIGGPWVDRPESEFDVMRGAAIEIAAALDERARA